MRSFVTFFLLLTALAGSLFAQTATYDTLSIYDLQYVADPATDDASPFMGDTVVVKGLVMHSPRDLWVGARWSCYIVDADSFPKPWSGFFIIQHDTIGAAANTLLSFLEPGMEAYFTGVVATYNGFTQLALLTAPGELVPVEILTAGNPLPDPVVLTAEELGTNAFAEKWESMWVRIEDATVVSNGLSSNTASLTDASGGTTYLDDYFLYFRTRFDDGLFEWPSAGTNMNAQGFIRQTGVDQYGINPRTEDDFETLSNPPEISDVVRMPGVPLSSDAVTVSAVLTDNISIASATLHYSVDEGAFMELPMSVANGDTFTAVIPAQADNSVVRYYLTAVDNVGETAVSPGDISQSILFYVVRDGGLTIRDLQYTLGYDSDASGFDGYEVTVQGVVTSDSSHFSNTIYIQDFSGEAAWSGIWVRDYNHHTFQVGDLIEVTGTVEENYGVTRIADVDSAAGATLISSGHSVEPVVVTTGEVANGGENAEALESVLIKVKNVTVTSENLGYGELGVDDGSGELPLDDIANHFEGSYGTLLPQDAHVESITGVHYYSFGNYKLLPRHDTDIVNVTDIAEVDNFVVNSFRLEQNYPNPFNPTTQISFTVPESGLYSLSVFNVLGQEIRSLASGPQNMGVHSVQWDGRDNNGNLVGSGIYFYALRGKNVNMSKKMVLLK